MTSDTLVRADWKRFKWIHARNSIHYKRRRRKRERNLKCTQICIGGIDIDNLSQYTETLQVTQNIFKTLTKMIEL